MRAGIPSLDVRFVKELYPRIAEHNAAIERYRAAIEHLPPIVVARDGVLVDGYHRWQAHKREGLTEIEAENLGNLTDAEIVRESITRNAKHGQQLSAADKKRLAGILWRDFGAMPPAERVDEIATLLSVSERSVQAWTQDVRATEKAEQQAKAWDMWLNCLTQEQIAEEISQPRQTVTDWIAEKRKSADFGKAPDSRQHFDIWQFNKADGDSSYFGQMPPQVVENLLWFYTEPGQVVFDPFAGGGTTIKIAKAMGRRVWSSDLAPSSPLLPIHPHNILDGWPADAPKQADLILLDPPHWQSAAEQNINHPQNYANRSLEAYYAAWAQIVQTCAAHLAANGYLAYIIGPTFNRENGSVIDHALQMLPACRDAGLRIDRRIIVPFPTEQISAAEIEWAREKRYMLPRYRDLVVLTKAGASDRWKSGGDVASPYNGRTPARDLSVLHETR